MSFISFQCLSLVASKTNSSIGIVRWGKEKKAVIWILHLLMSINASHDTLKSMYFFIRAYPIVGSAEICWKLLNVMYT